MNCSQFIHLNHLNTFKFALKGPRPPGRQYLYLSVVGYLFTVVYAKMLKETEKHSTALLLFLSLVAFQLGEGQAFCPPPPLATPMMR